MKMRTTLVRSVKSGPHMPDARHFASRRTSDSGTFFTQESATVTDIGFVFFEDAHIVLHCASFSTVITMVFTSRLDISSGRGSESPQRVRSSRCAALKDDGVIMVCECEAVAFSKDVRSCCSTCVSDNFCFRPETHLGIRLMRGPVLRAQTLVGSTVPTVFMRRKT